MSADGLICDRFKILVEFLSSLAAPALKPCLINCAIRTAIRLILLLRLLFSCLRRSILVWVFLFSSKLVRASFLHISPLTLARPSLKMAPSARSFEVASYAYKAFSLVLHLVHSYLLSASLLLQMIQVVPELVLKLLALISAIGMVNLD